LSRPAQMAIQKLTAVMEEMQAGAAGSPASAIR
ncbi:MAG: LysR family transcriptional regulator, partial [Klebsiella sp.]|nr:LysR family transcriptional regulator [Klebsiella sp.]